MLIHGGDQSMARGHSFPEFQTEFSDEASCTAFLMKRRWPNGFVCPACSKARSVALKSRPRLIECLDCGHQASVTAGTVMHRSKMPLKTWFWAAHLMATHSNGMSARQLEDQLGVTYKTAWLLTQKLRRSMVNPNRDLLEGVVEIDQAEIPFRVGDTFFEPGNAGKILIAGAVEVIDRNTNAAKPRRKGAKYLGTRSGRLRLAEIADNTAESIEAFVKANVKPGSTLITDGHASFPGLSSDYRHDPRVVGKMAAHIVLPWTHRAFALLKRWALGTYHGLRSNHINTYLDEFVFRYNRRFYRHISFETLLGFAVHRDPITYWDIIGRANPRKSRITLKPMIDKDGRHVLNSAKTQDIGEPELTG
jgi:Zn ribbon nucleic-acid-binding protein